LAKPHSRVYQAREPAWGRAAGWRVTDLLQIPRTAGEIEAQGLD